MLKERPRQMVLAGPGGVLGSGPADPKQTRTILQHNPAMRARLRVLLWAMRMELRHASI